MSNVGATSIVLLINLAVLIIIPVTIGVYVYRDAARRGMNAALWTLIAVLAPILTGFIIYLLVRGNYSDLKCPDCGTTVTEQYVVCPKCGARLKASCLNCDFPIEAGWTVCPKCTSPLPECGDVCTPPIRKKDTGLGKILVLVILVPFVLLLLLGIFNFGGFGSGGAMSVGTGLTAEQYSNSPAIAEWIDNCNQNPDRIYALRYQTGSEGQKTTRYLVYRPSASGSGMPDTEFSGLFRRTVELRFYDNPRPGAIEGKLTSISSFSNKFVGLKVFVNGQKADVEIMQVDFDPT